ncbi:hypothetical protein DL95DRAFT_399684, partial [Leptodontidium sp. 2 PMI_412]
MSMVLLSATLPPSRLDELRGVMYISDFRLIRMKTVRPTIRYLVRRCPNKGVMTMVKEMAERRGLRPGERGIFYCRSRDDTEEVAKALGCPFYHSMSADRDAAIAKWLSESGFIAATSA